MLRIRIAPDSLARIVEACHRAGLLETGGLLFGFETPRGFVIEEATGPGAGARASAAHWTPNPEFQREAIRDAESRGLVLLGEWHKHPWYIPGPSGGDRETVRDLLQTMPGVRSYLTGIATDHAGSVGIVFHELNRAGESLAVSPRFETRAPDADSHGNASAFADALVRRRFPEFVLGTDAAGGRVWRGEISGVPVEVHERDEGSQLRLGMEVPSTWPSTYAALAAADQLIAEGHDRERDPLPWYRIPARRPVLRDVRAVVDAALTARPATRVQFLGEADGLRLQLVGTGGRVILDAFLPEGFPIRGPVIEQGEIPPVAGLSPAATLAAVLALGATRTEPAPEWEDLPLPEGIA